MIDPTKPYYHTIKTSLKSVVRNTVVSQKLENAALLVNRIMIHTLQFMKLYFISCYDLDQPLPYLDEPFVTAVMKILCVPPTRGRPPKPETQLVKDVHDKFYIDHYKPIMQDELNYENLSTVLEYLSTEVRKQYQAALHFLRREIRKRFTNASSNIWKVARSAILGQPRPAYLQRAH